jgi:transposase-like protein
LQCSLIIVWSGINQVSLQSQSFSKRDQRDGKAAARFFRKVLKAQYAQAPQVIPVDKNATYPVALKNDATLATETALHQSKYWNNVIEQHHPSIKRIVKPMLGFKSFNSARRTLRGLEAMKMLRKGKVQAVAKGKMRAQIEFVSQIFGLIV